MSETAATFITAGASFFVAVVAGSFAFWNGRKANQALFQLQRLKSDVDKDLEKLRAKLSHGQIINSTQWNAEFSSYQAIWKAMVAVRAQAFKIMDREKELIALGLPDDYLASTPRVEIKKELMSAFAKGVRELFLAIHENAPFYPSPIREASNETQIAAKDLIDKHLKLYTHEARGIDLLKEDEFVTETKVILRAIVEGVDAVESLIRARLADVRVVDSLGT